MAISERDSFDYRRRIDEQDRFDAEENMVVAMTSVSTASGGSSTTTGAATSNTPAASVSTKRRSRPPPIPPPPNLMAEPTPRKWNYHKAIVTAVAVVAFTGASVAGVVLASGNNNKYNKVRGTGMIIRAAPVILVDKPVRLREMPSPHFQIQHTKYSGQTIPAFYDLNAKDFADVSHHGELPIMWRVPFSGDEAWTQIMGTCMKVTQAADEQELLGSYLMHTELQYVATATKGVFFNLDLSTWAGIEQAKAVNLAALDRVDVITSPILRPTLSLLDDFTLSARVFCTMKHPAIRSLAFFYLGAKNAHSRYYDPALLDVTIEQYAAWPTDREEFNFMVKSLVSSGNELISTDEITKEDLDLAKNILQHKFLVLVSEDKYGSWTKLQAWMGWKSTQSQRKCEDGVMSQKWPDDSKIPMLGAQEVAYTRLIERHSWDVQLYEFAVLLFEQQSEILVQ